ncbi:MAG: hypothetical protein WCR66_12505 [Bacteroidota bacterium]
MFKLFFTTSIIFFGFLMNVFAQQEPSPLMSSFQTYQKMKEATTFNLNWISLGPTVNSARADVVQVDTVHPGTMYVGYGSGGLWKTIDNGLTWNSIFENQASYSIGDFAIAPSNSNILYIGTGEHLKKPRNFTLPGTGMYRSDDAGKTWQHIGLDDSWSIAEIAVHPQNPNIVLVSVIGHLWTKNKNRGLYRTEDGGKTWEQVLYKNDMTGGNDIVITTSNPQIMYTTLWEVYPGISGEHSGVYKSSDGGKTWEPCKNGLPSGPKVGRISVSVSFTNPDKAYALVDNLGNAKDQAAELYKTVDGGITWTKTHAGPFKIFSLYGWYFTNVYVNPKDDEEVFCLGIRLAHSTDGGKTFSFIGGKVNHMTPSIAQGLHLDQSELWINPNNPNHLALGNDGGLYVSFDKGLSWMHYNNIPTGEFYDIAIDSSTYTIYGGTQDDATVYGPAKELNTQYNDPWKYLWIDPWDGGDGCITQVDPMNKNIIYYSQQHGDAVRLDRVTDKTVSIKPTLPKSIHDTLKFNYITPYFISAYQNKTLYHGGNYIFKSTNSGDTWNVISPNISISTFKDKNANAAGALVESPIKKGLLYTGTDKGAFWVSKNDGNHWQESSLGLANNYIRSISASKFKVSRVYLCMTGINNDDLHSYIYASEDYGAHWKCIVNGLPDEPFNVIKEDPTNENILYAGGLRGVFVSINRGLDWSLLGNNLPQTAIADFKIHLPTMDLVVATHGRGIYKINLKPIQQSINLKSLNSKNQFFEIDTLKRPWFNSNGGEPLQKSIEKVDFTFWLNQAQLLTICIRDKSNKEIWKINYEGKPGLNNYRWNLVLSKKESNEPYFIHYEKFIEAGKYTLMATSPSDHFEQPFIVVNGISPYIEN